MIVWWHRDGTVWSFLLPLALPFSFFDDAVGDGDLVNEQISAVCGGCGFIFCVDVRREIVMAGKGEGVLVVDEKGRGTRRRFVIQSERVWLFMLGDRDGEEVQEALVSEFGQRSETGW